MSLVEAAENGHVDEVRALLAAGANVNLADDVGRTALMRASQKGRVAVVEMLLAAEPPAAINQADNDGHTALMTAIDYGHTAIVELLLAAEVQPPANVNQARHNGWTALIAASFWGRTAVVEMLLAAEPPANVNQADNHTGWTALMVASHQGRAAVVKVLLAAGADVNRVDKDDRTALMWASWNRHHAIAALLRDAAGIRARHLLGRWRAWFRMWRITNYWWRVAGEGQHAPGAPGRKRDRDAYVAECI
jgi:serine/threonine-protein phosphatase 6 regulatory ankyrin repeat subunit B